jgi:Tat protein translocase TatC
MILKPLLDRLFKLREKTSRAASGDAEGDTDPHEKPFLDHLEDLRKMFFRMIIAQIIFTGACFVFHETLFEATYLPIDSSLVLNEDGTTLRSKIDLSVLSPAEPFMLSLKVAFISGFILAFPFHAYFLAGFIFPGLTSEEKKYLTPGIAVGFILFLMGASFAFLFALPFALQFLFSYGENLGVASNWRLGYYIGFVTQVTLIFGFCWELPLVVTILVKLRLLTFRAMKGSRSIAIMALCILSAVLTPPDPVTMVFMAVPMIILDEICIWIAYFLDRKRDAVEAEEEAEYQEWLVKHTEEEARLEEERK